MRQTPAPVDYSPEAISLLFTDKQGKRLNFDDVVAEGLEPGYEDRIPALRRLADESSPYERLLAVCMLAAWAQPFGMQQIADWAEDPHATPWSDAPVVFDRLYGSDQAFDLMAEALSTSYYVPAAAVESLRDRALDALLRIYHRFYFASGLALALHRSGDRLPRHSPSIRAAVEASLARVARGERVEFDLPVQTALLLGPLRNLGEDTLVAQYANRILDIHRLVSFRALRELASQLGSARGPETLAALHRMAGLGREDAEPFLSRALERRSAQEAASGV